MPAIFIPKRPSAAPKSIAFASTDGASSGDSIAVSGVLAGDIVFVLPANFSATPPTRPSTDWTIAGTATRLTAVSMTLGYQVAASDGAITNTGAWSGANRICYAIYRPTNGTLSVRGTPPTATSPGFALPAIASPLATSWCLSFAVSAASVSYVSGVTGTLRGTQLGGRRFLICDTNGPCGGSYPEQAVVTDVSTNGNVQISVELEIT